MESNNAAFHEAQYKDKDGLLQATKVPVVQELARQKLVYLPKRFISLPPADSRRTPSTAHCRDISVTIPTIDLAQIQPGSEPMGRPEELAKFGAAAKDWGLFLITNHGIESGVLNDVKDAVRGFFNLSYEEKKGSVGTYASVDNMGYGRNFVRSENQPSDWIDRLTMKAAPHGATQGLRVWPQNPPNFRQAVEKYAEEGRKICNFLLEALAEVLSLETKAFIQHFDPKQSEINMRVNYYPPCPRPDLALGLTPHSDASALSLLIQFDASNGLQLFKNNRWFTVTWPCDALLVNFGDFMEIMSDGCFKSTWHRAVTQRDVERFSVALFYNPPSETEIEPIKSGASSNRRYKKVVVGEYLQHYYNVSPTATKEAIKFAQL